MFNVNMKKYQNDVTKRSYIFKPEAFKTNLQLSALGLFMYELF